MTERRTTHMLAQPATAGRGADEAPKAACANDMDLVDLHWNGGASPAARRELLALCAGCGARPTCWEDPAWRAILRGQSPNKVTYHRKPEVRPSGSGVGLALGHERQREVTRKRKDDLRVLVSRGATLAEATRAFDITAKSLRKWCENHKMTVEYRMLASRGDAA